MSGIEKNNRDIKTFLSFLKAGLWENSVQFSSSDIISFEEIFNLAEEQSVVGVVTAGLEYVSGVSIPKENVLTFVGSTLQIEEHNKAMNNFIAGLIERMREADIYSLLIKGQGIAQCYEKPLWRASGDVDLYLNESNFQKAKNYFKPIVHSFKPDNKYTKHISMYYGPWIVEIHADQKSPLSPRINKVMKEIHKSVFNEGNVRSWSNGDTSVFLPSPDNDIIIVFVHYLNHFYKGGIGLRQICDWCRLLWTYRNEINQDLLESRIKRMGLVSEWKAFAALAVDYLNMPKSAMPLYDNSLLWKRKSSRIMSHIIKVGNFGHNRDSGFRRYTRLLRKTISFGRIFGDVIRHARIFPLDTFVFLPTITLDGIRSVIRGE